MNRKQFCTLAVPIFVGGMGAGCGAFARKELAETITNPGAAGVSDLSRLTLKLAHPQSAYIDYNTGFLLQWNTPADAPPATRVRLYRFLEGRGGQKRVDEAQDISVVTNTDGSYTVFRQGFLAPGGVYYIDIYTDTDRVRRGYIVAGGRSETAATRGVEITGGSGSLRNLQLNWSGDRNPVGLAADNWFMLTFPSESDAPAQFYVRLRRYKERRGTDNASANEQRIGVSHDPGTGTWTVRRTDNFLLERGATYILEVVTDGEAQRNYVFLTEI